MGMPISSSGSFSMPISKPTAQPVPPPPPPPSTSASSASSTDLALATSGDLGTQVNKYA